MCNLLRHIGSGVFPRIAQCTHTNLSCRNSTHVPINEIRRPPLLTSGTSRVVPKESLSVLIITTGADDLVILRDEHENVALQDEARGAHLRPRETGMQLLKTHPFALGVANV